MKKFIAVLLSAVMLIVLPSFSDAANPISVTLKGDINLDKKVDSADTRAVLRVVTGDDAAPMEDSDLYKRMKMKTAASDITMEDVRAVNRASLGYSDYSDFYTKTELTALFNTLANQILSTDFIENNKMTKFSRIDINTRVKLCDFSPVLKSLGFDEDPEILKDLTQDVSEIKYTDLFSNIEVSSENAYFPSAGAVSMLSEENISGITIELNKTADLLNDMPSTFVSDGGNSCSIVRYKKVNLSNLIKMTVKIAPETCPNTTNNSKIFNTAAFYEEMRKALSYQFSKVDDPITLEVTNTPTSIVMGVTAELYFSSETFAPVAAAYTVNADADNTVKITFSGISQSLNDVSYIYSKTTQTIKNIYLFSGFYK